LKKLHFIMVMLVALVIAVPLFCIACAPEGQSPSEPGDPSTPAEQKPIELSLASMHAPTSVHSEHFQRWADMISEASDGMLTIRHYASNTLIPGPEMRTGVKNGVADMGTSFIYGVDPGFEVGVNLTQLVRGLNTTEGVQIFEDIWNEFPELMESQWQDYKILWIIPTHPAILYTTDKAVNTMEDIKGLELRVPSAILANFVKNLGGSPVSMSTADWITSLDKGTTDGGASTVGSMYDFQIAEKFKYATNYAMGSSINFLIMNKDSWNNLSPEMQKVIDDSLEWARQDAIDTWTNSESVTLQFSKDNGIEFIDLSPEEYARWDAAIQPIYDDMAAEMDELGYPGTELVNFAIERAQYYHSR
jgi:TRAP-type C4-dicarboxylate transport system substrate-binding protein